MRNLRLLEFGRGSTTYCSFPKGSRIVGASTLSDNYLRVWMMQTDNTETESSAFMCVEGWSTFPDDYNVVASYVDYDNSIFLLQGKIADV